MSPALCRFMNCAAWEERREAKIKGTGCGHRIFNDGCMWTDEERREAQRRMERR